jgi:hypothetical protein
MNKYDLKSKIRVKKYKKPYEGIADKTEIEKRNIYPNILNQDFKSLKYLDSFRSRSSLYFKNLF